MATQIIMLGIDLYYKIHFPPGTSLATVLNIATTMKHFKRLENFSAWKSSLENEFTWCFTNLFLVKLKIKILPVDILSVQLRESFQ